MSQAAYANSPYPTVLGYTLGPDIAEAFNPDVPRPGLAAVKVIVTKVTSNSPEVPDPAALKRIIKEIRVHETLKHKNVLELMGSQDDQNGVPELNIPPAVYIVLDFAVGGDLFDQIVPDVGLGGDGDLAHFYFVQLMQGLAYCHSRGVCHRDLKPENLLLDGRGNLLISDFGLCAVFKYKGQERNLAEACGSPPYAAPELAYGRPYRAEPIDMWSAGIILFTLLVGNTPWDEPTSRSEEFDAYLRGELVEREPWTRIRPDAMSLLRKLLHVSADKRITLKDATTHRWFRAPEGRPNPLIGRDGLAVNGAVIAQRLASVRHAAGEIDAPDPEVPQIIVAIAPTAGEDPQNLPNTQLAKRYAKEMAANPTQPFTCTVQLFTQHATLASQNLQRPNTSMFVSRSPLADLVSALVSAFQQLEIVATALRTGDDLVELRVDFLDNRKQMLEGRVVLSKPDMGEDSMDIDDSQSEWIVNFRRRKGDTLQWKKLFRTVLHKLPSGMVFAR